MELKIDPEFSAMHRPLTADERMQLTENIVSDGKVLDPVVYWAEEGIILDGENRYTIARAKGLPYPTEPKSLPDRKAAKIWILNHQAGRRNLDSHGMTRIRYQALQLTDSVEAAASMLGVSKRAIERSREAMRAVERLPAEMQERYANGTLVTTEADLKRLGDLSDEELGVVVDKMQRNPEALLADVIPPNRSRLSKEDFESLKEMRLDGEVRQKISTGSIKIDSRSIKKLGELPPTKQVLVSSVLAASDISDLSEAIRAVEEGTPKKTKVPQSVAKLAEDVDNWIGKAARAVDEIGGLIGDRSRPERDDCITALQHFQTTFERWVNRYRV